MHIDLSDYFTTMAKIFSSGKIMTRLKGLDGIRGFLAIIVALSHAFGHFTGWNSGIYPIENASFAVDIFFVLSGIVLYHVHLQQIQDNKLSLSSFFIKRFMRLYPMHLFGMLLIPLAFMISIQMPYPEWIGKVTPKNLLGDLLMMSSLNFGFDLSTNQPAWSISVEFYIGTLIAYLFCKKRMSPFLLAAFTVLFFYASQLLKDTTLHHIPLWNHGIIRCLFCMSSGVIGYMTVQKYLPFFVKNEKLSAFIGIFGFFLLCVIVAKIHLRMEIYFPVIIFLSLSIALIGIKGFNFLSFLDSRFCIMLGKRSFSIYLMHTPLIYLFINLRSDSILANSIVAALAIALSILVSGFTVKYIEKPFITLLYKKHAR